MKHILAAGFLTVAALLFWGAYLIMLPVAKPPPPVAAIGPIPLDPSPYSPQQRINRAFDCLRLAKRNGGTCD